MTSFNSANATPSVVSEFVSTSKEANLQEPLVASIDSGPVQAYAKLEGEEFCYYIRTLQVSLGRKVTNPDNVDIPLGNTKSVSRQHARLFYNFSTQRFELMVFGKNGAFVNEQFIERGITVPLENKTKIQIGEMAFVFLLPKSETVKITNNNALPTNNDDNFGYISTPHQLEKNLSRKQKLQPQYDEDEEDDDELLFSSEILETINQYNSKDIKPPYSYASLIAQAINSSKDKKMTLNGIYNYITTNYPYYQMIQNGWQNSIRHNLSLNKAFVKVPRGETEPGKGAFWTIDINAETQFTNGVYKRNKRIGGNNSIVENVKKKSKKDHLNSGEDDVENDQEHEEEEEADELAEMDELIEEADDNDKVEEKVLVTMEKDVLEDTTQSLLVANAPSINTIEVNPSMISIKHEEEKPSVVIIEERKREKEITVPETLLNTTTTTTATNDIAAAPEPASTVTNSITQDAQEHLQLQLQNTIRQHLLDPVRYPLPPSIAQLLPSAIAQLPPQLAGQFSSTLQTAIKVGNNITTVPNSIAVTTTAIPATTDIADVVIVKNNEFETEKEDSPIVTK